MLSGEDCRMGIFKSLSEAPDMAEVFRKFDDGLEPLMEYHDIILRGDSPLTVAERELIAAYVSGLNACNYCFGAHQAIAETQGIDPELFQELMEDPATSEVKPELVPLLAYVKKLTLTPSRITPADAEAVYEAGWPERALFHAIAVCALFNFMNRMVDGTGISPSNETPEERRKRFENKRDNPNFYKDFGKMVRGQR